jgi:hypothetical protein
MRQFGRVSCSWYLLHTIFGYSAGDIALSLGCDKWSAASLKLAASQKQGTPARWPYIGCNL